MDSEEESTCGRAAATVTQHRGTSEISATSVASKGNDFNVLHESLCASRAFCSILHGAQCVSTLKKLYKRGSSYLINNKRRINA